MKNQIFKNWNFFRILRLILGIVIIIQSIYTRNYTFGIIGLLFATTSIFNVACCGSSCSTTNFSKSNEPEDIAYEEVVKSK